jgi:hypothetical protein
MLEPFKGTAERGKMASVSSSAQNRVAVVQSDYDRGRVVLEQVSNLPSLLFTPDRPAAGHAAESRHESVADA